MAVNNRKANIPGHTTVKDIYHVGSGVLERMVFWGLAGNVAQHWRLGTDSMD